MGAPRTTPRVLSALNKKRGQTVTLEDLVKMTGLDGGQVQSAIKRLVSRDGLSIVEVVRANAWRYEQESRNGQTPVPDTMFEVIGTSAKGDLLVRGDVTNTIYKVVPI